MAKRKRTVLQLLEDLAEAVDFPRGFTTTTFVTKTRALAMLSQSAHAFAQKHQAFGLLAKTATIDVTVADGTDYDLPDDFCALIGIDTDPVGVRATYEIFGDQVIVSTPTCDYTLELRYVPELPLFNGSDAPIGDFSADTDYLLCKGAIDQWVVLDTAIKIITKQDKDPSAKMALKAELEENLVQNLIDRDAGSAQYVQNTWGRDSCLRDEGCD